jgi:hypothetical protein
MLPWAATWRRWSAASPSPVNGLGSRRPGTEDDIIFNGGRACQSSKVDGSRALCFGGQADRRGGHH